MSLDTVFGQVPTRRRTPSRLRAPAGRPRQTRRADRRRTDGAADLYDAFSAVDPTGMDSNPFLRATSEFLQQALGAPLTRPDEQLNDDIAALLNDSGDLGEQSMGVVDATPAHHRTLYFFRPAARRPHGPASQFDPDPAAVETLERCTNASPSRRSISTAEKRPRITASVSTRDSGPFIGERAKLPPMTTDQPEIPVVCEACGTRTSVASRMSRTPSRATTSNFTTVIRSLRSTPTYWKNF